MLKNHNTILKKNTNLLSTYEMVKLAENSCHNIDPGTGFPIAFSSNNIATADG
jgi:hypothetical protein